jgi:3'-phosphoadenosine 5'-phosphosulfate sulfotransferase (PAPS reductase)/FAD synthetase
MTELRLIDRDTPEDWIARAKEAHSPIRTFCLFSGGSDSLVLAHRCRDHYDELVHIDTGTAVPGVLDHVRQCAEDLGKPLRVMRHDFDAFRLLVVGGTDPSGKVWQPLGFPGPAQHGRTYTRLKERMLEKLLREAKEGQPRSARILALSGIRRAESARRATRYPITRRGSMVFCNPLIEWTDKEMSDYRDEHDLRLSDVAALLHRSGECQCGCYADEEEREMLRSLWPEWFEERIGSLEREAGAAGIKFCKWGEPRGGLATGSAGELCSSCDAMAERKQLTIDEAA